MAFHGLFIGIDRYQSPRVSWLSCARRDAAALEALFTDTLGGDPVLLVDEGATRSAIEQGFRNLENSAPDDVVVVTFSGHGTPTHEIVTYDTDPANLTATAISLDDLTEWFSRIPARQLVCVLDCCFSGGAGAKLLQADVTARSLASTDEMLSKMSGNGRFILTASSPTEPAYENQKLRHGFLTYFLIEALTGAEEAREGGLISVYRLLEYVSKRVEAAADEIGQPQHPAFRGQLDGSLRWPVFEPGSRFFSAFPDRKRVPVTADLSSLLSYGFPDSLVEAWAGSIPGLNALQIDAINDFDVLEGRHLLVSSPTSSGKTMIGELAALRGVVERQRAFFLMPLKALVNDKHAEFLETYSSFGLRVIRATGEISDDDEALMRGQYDVCLMTYEKFTGFAVGSPHILNQVGTVVIDEVQMIADAGRGTNVEFLLTWLRMQRRRGIEPQIVALSAVIGDTNGFDNWLGTQLLRREERPVPLEEGLLLRDGSFRYLDADSRAESVASAFVTPSWGASSSQHWVIPLVKRLVQEGKQVIVFRETRGLARGCAGYLARELGLPAANDVLASLPAGDPSAASRALRDTLAGGVAFHISDLEREERLAIEVHFRRPNSPIRVIAATTTLAMGVNTPAEAVVIVGLAHPNGPYSVAEYKNMVGRAGRLGFADKGYSYLLALSANEEHQFWNKYVLGSPEDVTSHFIDDRTDPRSLIIRVIAAMNRIEPGKVKFEDAIEFLESSYGVFLRRREQSGWTWDLARLDHALDDLVGHGLITKNGEFCELTELGRVAGESGIEIESFVRLVAALRSVPPDSLNDPTLIAAAQLTVELDQVLFPINKKSTQKEPVTWRAELVSQHVHGHVMGCLNLGIDEFVQATRRAKKAVACLLWVSEMSLDDIEKVLTRFDRASDAAGAVRNVATRTCDILPTVCRVAELLHPGLDLAPRRRNLLVRLQVGVPAGAVQLAGELGNQLSRADYRTLLQNGVCGVEALTAASDNDIMELLAKDERKLRLVRTACARMSENAHGGLDVPPIPTYQA